MSSDNNRIRKCVCVECGYVVCLFDWLLEIVKLFSVAHNVWTSLFVLVQSCYPLCVICFVPIFETWDLYEYVGWNFDKRTQTTANI